MIYLNPFLFNCLLSVLLRCCFNCFVSAYLSFYRQHVFAVQWQEEGIHRIRWFRAAYGIKRAKEAATKFRKTLEAVGK